MTPISINSQTKFVISHIVPGKYDNHNSSNKMTNQQQQQKQFQKKYSHLFKVNIIQILYLNLLCFLISLLKYTKYFALTKVKTWVEESLLREIYILSENIIVTILFSGIIRH